jgi:nicotinamide riboside kinase
MDQLIIHISGPSGSGKSTLGEKIKRIFQDKIIVKDLDDLKMEHQDENADNPNVSNQDFIRTYKKSYQSYINKFIKKTKGKPILFVGINTFVNKEWIFFRGERVRYPAVWFNVHAKYNYYITISLMQLVEQAFDRGFEKELNEYAREWGVDMKDGARKKILSGNIEKLHKDMSKDLWDILNEFNPLAYEERLENWDKVYRDHDYKFKNSNEIFREVKKLLKKL